MRIYQATYRSRQPSRGDNDNYDTRMRSLALPFSGSGGRDCWRRKRDVEHPTRAQRRQRNMKKTAPTRHRPAQRKFSDSGWRM